MIKGREWLVTFVLLVLPAIGFGQWVGTLDLTSQGMNQITVDAGEDFVLTVGLVSNQPVSGVQYAFSVNGGADDALFGGLFDPGSLDSYGDLFSKGLLPDPNLFDPGDVFSQLYPGPVPLEGLFPELILHSGDGVPPNYLPGSLLNYTMTAPTMPGEYALSVADAILTNSNGSLGLGTGLGVNPLSVIVTPEPGSVLLLMVGGVGLLWRRRG